MRIFPPSPGRRGHRGNRGNRGRHALPRPRRRGRALRAEPLETRRLLAVDIVDDLTPLSDEFDDATTLADWTRIHETEGWNADQLQVWDIDGTQAGRMAMLPHTTVWYQDYRGPLVYKEITGDFVVTTEVHISDRDDIGDSDLDNVPDDAQYSLAGLMVRTPRAIASPADWSPGSMIDDGSVNGENFVFLSLGHGVDGQLSLEAKSTRNSNSQLTLTPVGVSTAQLQLARIGDVVFELYRLPGEDWVVHRRYHRDDMPETVQVGMVSYTDWGKASDFSPLVHNSTVLEPGVADPTPAEPFNPDLEAGFEFTRFARPTVPGELAGVNLLDEATNEQLLSFLGEQAIPNPDGGGGLPVIGDQTMTQGQDVLEIALVEMLGNGAAVAYDAELVDELFALDQELELSFAGDYYLNWGGQQEKWLTSPTGWHYLLNSDGEAELYQWNGAFESSELLATLASEVYDDPSLLHDPTLDADVWVVGGNLVIDPVDGFVGSLEVEVAISSGELQTVETIQVDVTNQAPNLTAIPNVESSHGDGPIVVALDASDLDGDPLELSATVAQAAYDLDQTLEFDTPTDYYENWGGQSERWLLSGSGTWHYVLPDGGFYRWEGSFAESVLLAELGSDTYADPTLLTEATHVPVTLEVVGQTLTIVPAADFVGHFEVMVEAFDGAAAAGRTFAVTIVNEAPTLAPIGDQVMAADQVLLSLALTTMDPEGDSLVVTGEVVDTAYTLDQSLGFWSDGDYYQNWGGQQEKWIRDSSNQWHFLLPTGELFAWNGTFESSDWLASLGDAVYNDPSLLTDAQPSPVTVQWTGTHLEIQRPLNHLSPVQIRVVVFDGYNETVEQFWLNFG